MSDKEKKASFKLPKFLRLGKGAMWLDIDGPGASGVKLFSFNEVFVGRGKVQETITEKGKIVPLKDQNDAVRDKFDNQNVVDYGYVEKQLDWYFDTSKIKAEKLSRVITAFNNGVLVEADPENPPKPEKKEPKKEFNVNSKGERIFEGKNKEMYRKLMNNKIKDVMKFVVDSPKSDKTRENLMDLMDYERRGFNPLSRPRGELLDLINSKLKEYGPGISAIRKNDLD
jgi:hypothetical protein